MKPDLFFRSNQQPRVARGQRQRAATLPFGGFGAMTTAKKIRHSRTAKKRLQHTGPISKRESLKRVPLIYMPDDGMEDILYGGDCEEPPIAARKGPFPDREAWRLRWEEVLGKS